MKITKKDFTSALERYRYFKISNNKNSWHVSLRGGQVIGPMSKLEAIFLVRFSAIKSLAGEVIAQDWLDIADPKDYLHESFLKLCAILCVKEYEDRQDFSDEELLAALMN